MGLKRIVFHIYWSLTKYTKTIIHKLQRNKICVIETHFRIIAVSLLHIASNFQVDVNTILLV